MNDRGLVITVALFLACWTAAGRAPAAEREPPGPISVEVTTLVGDLEGGVGGLAVDRLGILYVADFGEKVWKVTPYGDVEVFADSLYGASGNAIDSRGVLYQSNFWANTVSRIERDGTIRTFATGLQGPVGIAIDDNDRLVVCNCSGNSLARIGPQGELSRFAASDLFNCPNGITRDAEGNLYVVNFNDSRMLKISPTAEVTEFAQIPGGGNGHVAFAAGELFVTGFRANRVFRVSMGGEVSVLAGTGVFSATNGSGSEATFASPNGIAYDRTRDVLYTNDYLTPFLRRNFERGRTAVRKIRFPTLTERFMTALDGGGIEAAVQAYRNYKQSRPRTFTEIESNVLGYQLLQQGRVNEAIEVFKLNVETYPRSWNVYDSLAEGYKVAGDRDKAIEYYRKSLELNPGNLGARSQLQELGAE